MKSFRILSFMLGDDNQKQDELDRFVVRNNKNKTLIDGSEFIFVDDKKISKKTGPYVTLMIGPNGTGKSTVLKEISRILLGVYFEKYKKKFPNNSSFVKGIYRLEYKIGDDYVVIINGEQFVVNGEICRDVRRVPLPKKVVVNSLGISDKFFVKPASPTTLNKTIPYSLDFYDYIGTKSDNFLSSSHGFIQRALDLLVEAFSQKHLLKDIVSVFRHLEFNPCLSISYKIRRSISRGGGLYALRQVDELSTLIRLIREVGVRKNHSEVWINNIIADNQLMDGIFDYVTQLNDSDSFTVSYELNFEDVGQTNLSSNEFMIISILRKLRLMDLDYIKVIKDGIGAFDLKDSSSGELQILISFLSMASVIEDGCVVLIDEPEISLHPNWQMRYMDLIYKVFGGLANSHFIIATHSHFLVSDLLPEASSVLAIYLDVENRKINSNIIGRDTFGLSAEDVLYNVFKVRTTRNYYLEMELREALSLVSRGEKKGKSSKQNNDRLRELNSKFQELTLDKHDPMREIVSEITKHLESK